MSLNKPFSLRLELCEKIFKKIHPEIVRSELNEYHAEFIFYDAKGSEVISMCVADNANIIFSHDFAKAFWGEEPEYESKVVCKENPEKHWQNDGIESTVSAWQYHLQQMVLEENPLKYLEKFL